MDEFRPLTQNGRFKKAAWLRAVQKRKGDGT